MARHGSPSAHMAGEAPFPTRQLAILALCRICEPIAFMSIFPYAYYMIKSFGIAQTEAQISVYVGMVTSAFAFAECASGVFWGRLSDRIGRKKVLLGGLFGTGLSMLLFGFSRNLPMALFARALGGLLNGNIGVLQTTVAELVTVREQQPRAYSIMPSVWCLGTIIGSSLGGLLANPAGNWPLFTHTVFETYPYLLPNIVCTAVVGFGLTVGFLFLEETHQDIKYNRDRGCELGQYILTKIRGHNEYMPLDEKDEPLDEGQSMLDGHTSSTYRSTESSPTLCSTRSSLSEPSSFSLDKEATATPSLRAAFTRQACLIIVGIGILAFHTISLEQLLPILMSHKESSEDPVLPFKFTGGFAFSTQTIGSILAVQGVLQLVAQLAVFPWISSRLGSRHTFWLTIASYPFLYVMAPYLALLPKQLRIPGTILLLVWKVTAQSLSYPSLHMMLANSTPSHKVLGTLNGLAAASASVCRGFGPTLSGAVSTLGESLGYSGLAWWTIAIVAMIGWVPGYFMEDDRKRSDSQTNVEDAESGLYSMDGGESDADSVITLRPDETIDAVLCK